jgi:hypothetical protein
MGRMLEILDDIRDQIAADDDVLAEARKRRDLVAKAAMNIDGALRTFKSGSVAHGTVNRPVTDADGGIVLDRRVYPTLGPDSDEGEGPQDVVDELCKIVGPIVREEYPDARVNQSRRGLYVTFSEPVKDGQDPTVDLVVTLTRKDKDGLWIPDLDNNTWSASHPEKHTELFTGGSKEKRARRARISRLGKAWNKQWSDPALSSFNIQALALEYVTDAVVTQPFEKALTGWFRYAHAELEKGPTKDPAGVSDDLKLLTTKETALRRLGGAADNLEEALEADAAGDDDKVQELLAAVFRDYVKPPAGSKAAVAAALRGGNAGVGMSTTGIVVGGGSPLKTTRSYGGRDG